jgi:hypothetical protein
MRSIALFVMDAVHGDMSTPRIGRAVYIFYAVLILWHFKSSLLAMFTNLLNWICLLYYAGNFLLT